MIARFMPVIVMLLLTLVFGWLLVSPEKENTATTTVTPLPAVMLPPLEGGAPQPFATGNWRLINFFASWCVPCVVEHPNLMALKEKLPLTGIAYKDTTVMVKTLLQQRGNPYAQVLMDSEGAASIPFGITGVPESFLVNPDGNIVWHYSGPMLDAQVREVMEMVNGR